MKSVIANKKLRIEVSSLGAELQSVKIDGKERVWQNEDGAWDKHAPVLFPVCGNSAMILNGVNYDIKKHGIAPYTEFELVKERIDKLHYRLKFNNETLKAYPFEFRFDVIYKIKRNKLQIIYIIKNLSTSEMYYSCGGHESILLDKQVDEYKLLFDKKENVDRLELIGAYLSGEKGERFTGKYFDLGQLENDDIDSYIYQGIRSRRITLLTKDDKRLADLVFKGFNNIVLWHKKRSRFVCVEPWLSLPDTFGENVDFRSKYGVYPLKKGKKQKYKREIKYY